MARGSPVPAALLLALAASGCPALLPADDVHDGGGTMHQDSGGMPADDAAQPEDSGTSSDAAARDASTLDASAPDVPDPDHDGGAPLDAEATDAKEPEDATTPEDAGKNCRPNYGMPCAERGICGGTYDCDGVCAGGTLEPTCPCAPATCDIPSGMWSPCPLPPDYGQSCDTTTRCGGIIGCDGACGGGTPLPACECGTPTCNGCAGGTCDFNSQCMGGSCFCTINECACGSGSDGCSTCTAQGDIQTCSVDAWGCGSLSGFGLLCMFGCDPMTNQCSCAPDVGQPCFIGDCMCPWSGTCPLIGTVQCDGSCVSTDDCASVCMQLCPL